MISTRKEAQEVLGDDQSLAALLDLLRSDRIEIELRRSLVAEAWGLCMVPESGLGVDYVNDDGSMSLTNWRDLFASVGVDPDRILRSGGCNPEQGPECARDSAACPIEDHRAGLHPRPTKALTLYRGAPTSGRARMSWTSSLDTARRFAWGLEPYGVEVAVWKAKIEPWRIFAHIRNRCENEYVIDTTGLAMHNTNRGPRQDICRHETDGTIWHPNYGVIVAGPRAHLLVQVA